MLMVMRKSFQITKLILSARFTNKRELSLQNQICIQLHDNTRWVALMIQLGKFVGGLGGWGWVVADINYLYPARWDCIKNIEVAI